MATNKLVGRNIKILAEGFNPPIFNEYWLRKERLIEDQIKILENSLFTPQFVQVFTEKFNFLVLPDQLQFNITDDIKTGTEFVKLVFEKLTTVSFKAMGFNFDYLVPENEIRPGLFFVPKNPLFQEFRIAGAKFGTFLTKEYEGSILSLSVKPAKAVDPKGNESNFFHYSFNYHFDLQHKEIDKSIFPALKNWSKYSNYSKKLMSL